MHMPDAGGLNDQAAWLLDAFNVCNAAEAELKKDPGDENNGDR